MAEDSQTNRSDTTQESALSEVQAPSAAAGDGDFF